MKSFWVESEIRAGGSGKRRLIYQSKRARMIADRCLRTEITRWKKHDRRCGIRGARLGKTYYMFPKLLDIKGSPGSRFLTEKVNETTRGICKTRK